VHVRMCMCNNTYQQTCLHTFSMYTSLFTLYETLFYRKIGESDYQLRYTCLSVRLYVRMEQLGLHWIDFREI